MSPTSVINNTYPHAILKVKLKVTSIAFKKEYEKTFFN